MGRLKAIGARLSTIKPRLQVAASARGEIDRRRELRPWRKWYKTARWQALRWTVLVRDQFTCQMCGKGPQGDTSRLVADHRVPHRGIAALFWDEGNLQTLCDTPCHASVKAREEARG